MSVLCTCGWLSSFTTTVSATSVFTLLRSGSSSSPSSINLCFLGSTRFVVYTWNKQRFRNRHKSMMCDTPYEYKKLTNFGYSKPTNTAYLWDGTFVYSQPSVPLTPGSYLILRHSFSSAESSSLSTSDFFSCCFSCITSSSRQLTWDSWTELIDKQTTQAQCHVVWRTRLSAMQSSALDWVRCSLAH